MCEGFTTSYESQGPVIHGTQQLQGVGRGIHMYNITIIQEWQESSRTNMFSALKEKQALFLSLFLLRAHLENVHPKEHATVSETPAKTATSQLIFFTARHKLFVCSTTRGVHEVTCFVHLQGHEADQYCWSRGLQRVLSRIGTEVPHPENVYTSSCVSLY